MQAEYVQIVMTWGNMIDRCYNPKARKFSDYGGRGIKVCIRWHEFANFASDMAPRPDGFSLDRINVNGNYSPENCRWADTATQARNRRNNTYLTIGCKTMVIQDWAKESGTCHSTIRHRIKKGWSPEDAVFGRRFAKRYPDVEHNGESMSVPEWANRLGVCENSINRRIRMGMTPEESIAVATGDIRLSVERKRKPKTHLLFT